VVLALALVLVHIRDAVAGAVECYAVIKHHTVEKFHHTSDGETVSDVRDRFHVPCIMRIPKFITNSYRYT
jgi:hypothetical protein